MLDPTVLIRPSALALTASVLLLAACQRQEPPTKTPVEPPPVIVVAPPPVLDRAGLLQAMDLAASAYAEGRTLSDETLTGRRFLVRQAMGCGRPVDPTVSGVETGMARVAVGEDGAAPRLTLTPADWTPALPSAEGTKAWEAAEGFWLTWPWLRADGCPRPTASPPGVGSPSVDPAPVSPQSVGLAAVFEAEGSRLGRRKGRPYEFILRGGEQGAPVLDARGYRLVLEGRMTAFGDGRAIHCRASGPEQRPVCIATVRLERVAFETGIGQLLTEWR